MTEPSPELARVIEKVRRLLALADASRNDSEYERATALRQANALMDRYGVQIADLEGDELGPRGESRMPAGSAVWKGTVMAGIAKLYGCRVYRTTGREGEIFIVGRQHYRNVVIDMGQYVMASIEREARRHRGQGRGFGNAFRKGAASGMHGTVREIIEQRERNARLSQTPADPGTAMVLVGHYACEETANARYLAEQNVRLKSTRSTYSDYAGYDAGRTFGSGIGLGDQLGRSSTQKTLK